MLAYELDAQYASEIRESEINSPASRHLRDWLTLREIDVLERRLRHARGRLADLALAGEPS